MSLRGGTSAALLLAILAGCTRLPPARQPVATTATADARAESEQLADTLRKNNDLATCRSVLQRLNALRERATDAPTGAAANPQLGLLCKRLHLDADERAEVESSAYTLLDAHYLEQCLLFHEAVRNLELDRLPARARAQAAFDWAVRQVRLADTGEEPLPPLYALRRGWGTDWERTLVFLAVLDQLGIPGGVLYVPDTTPPRYDAIAVVDGIGLRFDPRKGDLVGEERPPKFETVCALSGIAPRMAALEKILGGRLPVKLTETVEGLPTRPNNPHAAHRLLRAFLPPEEGGADAARRRQGRFELSVTPWAALPRAVQEIPPHVDLGQQLRSEFETPFVEFILRPGAPRDLLLRGRFADAVSKLVAARDDLRRYHAFLEENPKARPLFEAWCTDARKAQEDLLLAQRQAASKTPGSAASLTDAQARLDAMWKAWPKARPVLMQSAAGPLHADSTFLLALTKHEQAVVLARTPMADNALAEGQRAAWQSAAEWWGRYLDESPRSPAAAAARLQQAQALVAGGDRAGAIAVLEAAGELPTCDQPAVAWRLQQLKGR